MDATDFLVDFAGMDWTSPAENLRVKEVIRGPHRLRLVEFAEGFEESDWCRRGHLGWVIDGELEIEFDHQSLSLKAGDALAIPAGEPSKHMAKVLIGTATLFLVERSDI